MDKKDFIYNTGVYNLAAGQYKEGLAELLGRFLLYQGNASDEEQWAWGAAISEVKALIKALGG